MVHEGFNQLRRKKCIVETVAKACVTEAREYTSSTVAAGRYLADQLLILMSMAGGGSFSTLSPSGHTMTNIGIIKRFLDEDITVNPVEGPESVYHRFQLKGKNQ